MFENSHYNKSEIISLHREAHFSNLSLPTYLGILFCAAISFRMIKYLKALKAGQGLPLFLLFSCFKFKFTKGGQPS